MWYFAWILGTFLACSFAIIVALTIERVEANAANKAKHTWNDNGR